MPANLDVVLEAICRELPHGGDHDSRRYIAEQLIAAAKEGKIALGELTHIGRRALVHLLNRLDLLNAHSRKCLPNELRNAL